MPDNPDTAKEDDRQNSRYRPVQHCCTRRRGGEGRTKHAEGEARPLRCVVTLQQRFAPLGVGRILGEDAVEDDGGDR